MSLYNKIIDLQKLHSAWKNVYKNKSKEGTDGVTFDEFEDHKNEFLKELWDELKNHTYRCQPVKLVPLFRGEKVRYISLFSMRDKVVQYSLAKELSNMYESEFSKSCCAYRSGSSALQASQSIAAAIRKMENGYGLKTDIQNFFDCILHSKLLSVLEKRIKEEDVLELIRIFLRVPSLEKTGELTEKQLGIYQGATIAPVLSNIYLKDFDRIVEAETTFYVRYSDDILILFNTHQQAEEYKEKLSIYLEEYGLSLNEKKTDILSFGQGFEFLGYRFDQNGISVPEKAERQLEERMEEVWLNAPGKTVEEKLEKCTEIVGGWEQYFNGQRELHSILEYAVWVFRMKKKNQMNLIKMGEMRKLFDNPYRDIAKFLANIWRDQEMFHMELLEYEQYLGLYNRDENIEMDEKNPFFRELLSNHRQYVINPAKDSLLEMIQLYSDLKMYKKAGVLMELSQRDDQQEKMFHLQDYQLENEIQLNQEQINRYMELFVGREDIYSEEEILGNGKRCCKEVAQPLLQEVIASHLKGDRTIGTYIQRSNGTVKYFVIDLDVSKGVLLQCTEEQKKAYLEKCFQIAVCIQKEFYHLGLNAYLEDSGNRGFHIWIFFSEWLPVRYANLLSDLVEQKMREYWKDGSIQAEYFPNKTRVRNGKKGQTLKLPWGIHPKTGRKSCFMGEDGKPLENQEEFLKDPVRCSVGTLKRILSANQLETEKNNQMVTEVDRNLEGFGFLDKSVETVLSSCNLMRFLCQKARTTHYLNHFERLSILYVFGHMGDEGKKFVHKVMSFTLNYSYQVTDKFIHRCPEKPISCLKLREQYKQVSAEIGCTCNFRRTKNCYPSPVLHALKNAEEGNQVTIPLSKTLTENRQQVLKDEINAVSKAQSIAERMLELRKQKRGLDKSLKKCEQELSEIFDDCQVDSMEIKMGLLVRRKTGEEYEWVIEL